MYFKPNLMNGLFVIYKYEDNIIEDNDNTTCISNHYSLRYILISQFRTHMFFYYLSQKNTSFVSNVYYCHL